MGKKEKEKKASFHIEFLKSEVTGDKDFYLFGLSINLYKNKNGLFIHQQQTERMTNKMI